MPNQPFVGGIDILPGNQGPPIPANALRLVTIGGAPYYTTDGVTFAALASAALATPSTAGLMSAAQFNAVAQIASPCYSQIIDLTTTGTYPIILPQAGRWLSISYNWEIKTTGGTVSVSPTFSAGTDASFVNCCASQTQTGFTTQAAETVVIVTRVSPTPAADLTTNGFQVKVTAGATGSSPVLTARFCLFGIVVPT